MAWGSPTGQRPALLVPGNGLRFQHEEVLRLNPSACDEFFRAYVDERFQHQLYITIFQPCTPTNFADHPVLSESHDGATLHAKYSLETAQAHLFAVGTQNGAFLLWGIAGFRCQHTAGSAHFRQILRISTFIVSVAYNMLTAA
jgi:hypothetical protein